MRVIARRTLKLFWEKHADSVNPLKIWYQTVSVSKWKSFAELKRQYGTVDAVGNERFVFDIKGNKYRLIAKIDFEFELVFIRFIGTHVEYDEMNKRTGGKNI
jgi:mRNA interferase HigB